MYLHDTAQGVNSQLTVAFQSWQLSQRNGFCGEAGDAEWINNRLFSPDKTLVQSKWESMTKRLWISNFIFHLFQISQNLVLVIPPKFSGGNFCLLVYKTTPAHRRWRFCPGMLPWVWHGIKTGLKNQIKLNFKDEGMLPQHALCFPMWSFLGRALYNKPDLAAPATPGNKSLSAFLHRTDILNHLCGPLLDWLQCVHVSLVLVSPAQ